LFHGNSTREGSIRKEFLSCYRCGKVPT
jgi:hypothetical protein